MKLLTKAVVIFTGASTIACGGAKNDGLTSEEKGEVVAVVNSTDTSSSMARSPANKVQETKDTDFLSNAFLENCFEKCSIHNFIGDDFSKSQGGYLYTIQNMGKEGSLYYQYPDPLPSDEKVGTFSFITGQAAKYRGGNYCGRVSANRRGTFRIILTSDQGQDGQLSATEPSTCVYRMTRKCYCPANTTDQTCKTNNKCLEMGGVCVSNCKDDTNFQCVPDICFKNKKKSKIKRNRKARNIIKGVFAKCHSERNNIKLKQITSIKLKYKVKLPS